MAVKLLSFGCAAIISAAMPFVTIAQESSHQPIPETASEDVLTAINADELVLVPVTFAGKQRLFVFDTGSSLHVFDQSFEELLGNPQSNRSINTSGFPINVRLFRAPELSVGKWRVRQDVAVTSVALSRVSEVYGRRIDGVVGVPFLRGRVVVMDFDERLLTVHNTGSWQKDSHAISISLSKRNDVPLVMLVAGLYPVRCLVDTGFNGELALKTEVFDKLVADGLLSVTGSNQSMGADGNRRSRRGFLDSCLLGPFRHKSVTVIESPHSLIGIQYLARFKVAFDVDNKKLHLQPGKQYARLYEFDKSGLSLLWTENCVVVDSIKAGSPAEKLDIRKGDILLELNGEAASGTQLMAFRSSLSQKEGTRMPLKLLRDGKSRESELVLTRFKESTLPTATQPPLEP